MYLSISEFLLLSYFYFIHHMLCLSAQSAVLSTCRQYHFHFICNETYIKVKNIVGRKLYTVYENCTDEFIIEICIAKRLGV